MTAQAETTPGLAVEFVAEVRAGMAALVDQQTRARDDLRRAFRPLEVPPVSGTVTAGGVLVIGSPELLGPRTGYYWDIRRVSIAGLNSSTEIANIYKGSTGTSFDAVSNNYVASIAGKAGTYGPGKSALILRGGQSISVNGTGLTAAEVVTVVMEGTEIEAPYIGAYLA